MTIVTEGRIFIAQMMREARERERLGAGLLSPGTKTWRAALDVFSEHLCASKSPTEAGRRFFAACSALHKAQLEHNACFVNFFKRRSRSGVFQIMTHEVAKHPLQPTKYDGILVRSYNCELRRRGFISTSGGRIAYLSWHALGRLYERSEFDVKDAMGIVGLIGIAGVLMRRSANHRGTSVSVAFPDDVMVTGVMRYTEELSFLDVLTVLPGDLPWYKAQREQAGHVARAVKKYLASDSGDPRGYADSIPVVPYNRDDYITRELRKEPGDVRQDGLEARPKV